MVDPKPNSNRIYLYLVKVDFHVKRVSYEYKFPDINDLIHWDYLIGLIQQGLV